MKYALMLIAVSLAGCEIGHVENDNKCYIYHWLMDAWEVKDGGCFAQPKTRFKGNLICHNDKGFTVCQLVGDQ